MEESLYLDLHDDEEKLHEVVQAVTDTQKFYEDTERNRELEASENTNDERDFPPVFNKRLFVTQGAVIITRDARKIMARNAKCPPEVDPALSKSEIQTMRSVVEGLKLIHKDQDYVKDVLARCATLETYNSFSYVVRKPWEDNLSCYYLVHGAVEVTYDMGGATESSSRNVYQPNIIYSHGTGEYLGIVSAEGRDEDIAPPATVYTKELCEFIRIDREKFHRMTEREQYALHREINNYFENGVSILSKIAHDVQQKVLHLIQKQEFQPNRVILEQGEVSDQLFIVISGRCQCLREIYIPEADKNVLFYLCCREKNDFFGEECLLDNVGSVCQIKTTTHTTVYKLHRTALKIVNYDKLTRILEENRQEFTDDNELRDRGYKNTLWNNYKHSMVKGPLKEHGKLKYLSKPDESHVIERPPTPLEEKKENMYRFVLKGSQYEPFRPKSAVLCSILKARSATALRPKTAVVTVAPQSEDSSEIDEDEDLDNDEKEEQSTMLISTDMAKKMEELYEKGDLEKLSQLVRQHKNSKEMMMKLFDENSELGQHIQKALESQEQGHSEKDGFMKNGVLATMESDDIVRKAMAMADKQSYQQRRRSMKNEEEWNTILHAENKQAKFLITANKMRISVLRKKLDDIEKQRNFNAMKHKDSRQRQKSVTDKENSPCVGHSSKDKDSAQRVFLLDKLKQTRYLTKEEAEAKAATLITSALFIHKAQERFDRKTTMDDLSIKTQCSEPLERKRKKRIRPSSAILTKAEVDLFTDNQSKRKGSMSSGTSSTQSSFTF